MLDKSAPIDPASLSGELSLLFCGEQACSPGHGFGPAMREYYLLHYCLSGRGIFQTKKKSYAVGPHEGFLILPQEVTFYQADLQEPWHYVWVAFRGSLAEKYLSRCGLSAEKRIFHCNAAEDLQDCTGKMIEHVKLSYSDEFCLQGLLYQWFSILAASAKLPYREETSAGNIYVSKAIEFMQKNYQNAVSITALANYVGLNRSYLTSLFQRQLHMSPRDFLMDLRIARAADLLASSDLSVSQVSRSCGYPDPLAFSKAFHRVKDCSPTEYRQAKRAQAATSLEK
ncbi:MAG: AraC family transcriptional regulator [Oscillospiraceae bacterium]|jgi:AraC-like DNA-binding protein|nr:AraC family transcriptional regulator [Oscillospiraceae bacterium]MDD3260657.1 AraC family transcriptional regulator [Oscillospiraceae bacterium]